MSIDKAVDDELYVLISESKLVVYIFKIIVFFTFDLITVFVQFKYELYATINLF